jgi:hypothetical protein
MEQYRNSHEYPIKAQVDVYIRPYHEEELTANSKNEFYFPGAVNGGLFKIQSTPVMDVTPFPSPSIPQNGVDYAEDAYSFNLLQNRFKFGFDTGQVPIPSDYSGLTSESTWYLWKGFGLDRVVKNTTGIYSRLGAVFKHDIAGGFAFKDW